MLHKEEEAFYTFWEKQRTLPTFKRKAFLKGLSGSLSIGMLILIVTEWGWYERANMVANSWGNGIWIVLGIAIASFGFAWIYQQFTAEMNEQRFQELKHIKSKK